MTSDAGGGQWPHAGGPDAVHGTLQHAGQHPRQRGWFARHWKWFVPAIVLGTLVVCGGAVSLLVGSLFAVIRASEPYQHGVQLVQNHIGLRDLLGEPIEPGFFFTGQISNQSGAATADYRIPVIGPRGRGVLVIDARKSASDQWEYLILRVEIFGEPTVVDLRGGG